MSRPSPPRAGASCRSSPKGCGCSLPRPCETSRTCSAPAIWRRSLRSWTIPKLRPTTGSSPWNCSRTPTSPPGECCRAARTPARRSSGATRASGCSPAPRTSPTSTTLRPSPRVWQTRFSRRTCATRRWRRSTCSPSATPATTCQPRSRSTHRRATSTSWSSWQREAARPTRASCSRRPRPCSIPTASSGSSTRSCARWARPPARRITWRW